ncbi:hypothetical protein OZX74_03810 [Bifidobacterium sp. ESL0798]|uniref:hypothetical protein n=1 Tax=Bifidobacterium sp. ESL0798 TaxID=2983235 RepID=UPI0023F95223|nr:hypothetical protein [Bifidobacterium sp. ESL0798]WEV74653.1 hypothetical protein OZX74_03810 [Bifidobacterium sp. ESL0798]
MAKSKLVKANRKIVDAAGAGMRKMSDTVTKAHRRIEDGFVDQYLTQDGESVGDTEARLRREHENKLRMHAERKAAKRQEVEQRQRRRRK